MTMIFIASSIPDLRQLPGGVSDKTAHFSVYSLLGVFAIRAFADMRWKGCTWQSAGQAWALAAVYGFTDEFHQSFVPGRTPALDDWMADAYGAAFAILVVVALAIGRRRTGREV